MGFALVMVKEHTRRTVHLRDNHTLGAINNECALIGHQRHITKIDLLFFDFLDGTRLGLLVNIKDDQLKQNLKRRSISQIALLAFFNVKFWWLKLIGNIFQHSPFREILDREDTAKHAAQAIFGPFSLRGVHLQELFI